MHTDFRPVSQILKPAALPYYVVNEKDIAVGASLGNSSIWVNTKANGAIERIFNVSAAQSLFGTIYVRYATAGHRLLARRRDAPEHKDESYVWLLPDAPATVEIHPAYQRRRYIVAGHIEVTETVWVPLQELTAGADPPLLHIDVELHNTAQFSPKIRAVGFARLRGSTIDDIRTRFLPDLGALVGHNTSRPKLVRIFGMDRAPSRYDATFDFGRVYDRSHQHGLANSTDSHGDILAALQYDLAPQPDERVKFTFLAGAYHDNEATAVDSYARARGERNTLQATVDYLSACLLHSQVLTPDPLINEGAMWSKVNMRRVMSIYPQGLAFTNDPGSSSNVVGRDAAWFIYGNDHFLPEFSCALLRKFGEIQYSNGKIPEFFNALDGQTEDDGLNINDDTPLFILAANHHHRSHGTVDRLADTYPVVAKAADYIISQMDDRDLIFCAAKDPRGSVWAIVGWRNIIPNYSINGATTEINAECAAALRAAGHMADNLHISKDAEKYFSAAKRVRKAMDRHLMNPDNGLYYLNIDVDGNVHTDVTGDEIFPVMFRTCDEDTGFRIISRLNAPDFWTDAGLRTASRFDALYDPSAYAGLIGGVWPGLTWWYAFAAARYHPEFMVKALRSSFEHYGRNPKANNTVPGEFSEWFDGESLVNRGMRLSPWEPPRFLWAAVEGVCGLMLTNGNPKINPIIPAAWKWVALRQCPYHDSLLSYFAVRQRGKLHLSATMDVETEHAFARYDEDISSKIACFSSATAVVALRRNATIALMVGNVSDQTTSAPLNLEKALGAQTKYAVRVYDSERDEWENNAKTGAELASLVFSIEANGYRLLELTAS
jgi:glycogen debranching enzyme